MLHVPFDEILVVSLRVHEWIAFHFLDAAHTIELDGVLVPEPELHKLADGLVGQANDAVRAVTIAFGAMERLANRRQKDDAVRVLKTLVSAKRAPVMAHEILAVEAVLYDPKLGYDDSVFDLVTAIQ